MNEFKLEDLMLRKEEATSPRTYNIKTNKFFNQERYCSMVAVVITHYIKIKIQEIPDLDYVYITDDINEYYRKQILFSIERTIVYNDLSMPIVRNDIDYCFTIIHELLSGYEYEDYCKHMIYRIFEKLKTKGYNNCVVKGHRIIITFDESSDVKESVDQYDTDLKSSSSVNY